MGANVFVSLPEYTMEEVAAHNTIDSCWLVANGYVYDATRMLGSHPAGNRCIMDKAGGKKNCSQDYDFHRENGKSLWDSFRVGKVVSKKPWP